jgi:hypothetical protein
VGAKKMYEIHSPIIAASNAAIHGSIPKNSITTNGIANAAIRMNENQNQVDFFIASF